jgi:Xaa-Pro aminopeptidase
MQKRIDKLLASIELKGAKAMLLHSPENIRYFSGFTGEGCVFVSAGTRVVLTDSRYTEQAQNQAPDYTVMELASDKFAPTIAALASDSGLNALGFEDDWMPVIQHKLLSTVLTGVELIPAGGIGVKIRSIKDAVEIGYLKKACDITDHAFQYALTIAKPGISEIELSVELKYYMAKQFNVQPSFEFIVAAGETGSMPHAIPSSRIIKNGDMVTLDFGAEYLGYKADMTRTFAVGSPSDKMREIYEIVRKAQLMASEALKPGLECKAIDEIARGYIRDCGYGSNFGHGLGHGVGLQIHEQPVLNPKSNTVLEPGMAVTVEPGIYLPGMGGVRIEDTCIITENGWESLFVSDKNLIIL